MRIDGKMYGVLFAICGAALLIATSSVLAAGGSWVDEVWNMVVFEKASYPGSNFDPYLEKLGRIRNDIIMQDHLSVKTETNQFLKMLADRAHGIHDVAADEIYNFALQVRPTEEPLSFATSELDATSERPMSVPDHKINTPYEGGPTCTERGCDYWHDDVFDAGAS
jgi:hypothetical protein